MWASELAELVAANRKLTDRVCELTAANAELDAFAAIAAHDLQEPLRGMHAYCELLLEDSAPRLDADGQRRLAALANLCQRLERLTGDLLGHARLGGRQSIAGEIDLNEVVGDVLATLEPALEQRGALVRVSSRLPQVAADAVAVGEVFRNLIGNALKFNASDSPTIEIDSLPNGELYVRDNGIGIEPRHHEAIFAMFRRLHATSQYAGSGLGLALVRKIVAAHGGQVRVESEVGQGSTFYFTLGSAKGVIPPAKPVPASAVNTPHTSNRRTAQSAVAASEQVL